MPSERVAKYFRDIVDAISLIEGWVSEAGGPEHAVYHDAKARSAIERQILIISEAAIRLDRFDPTAAPRLAPKIDWPAIRGIGNFIRHQYDDLERSILVDVVRSRLVDLRQACARA